MDKYGKILAVDDNPAILTALRLCLGGAFESVVALSDPAKILSVMERENISVVLLDMNFTLGMNTGHDGLLWLRTIRKKFPHIPVVLLTAYGDIGLAVKGMKEGAADFVTKPWDNNKLLGILREAVERSRKVAPLDEVTMDYVHKVVERCDGNISEAAKLLGITRQTLYAKIKRT
ncbi:MAG: DNA-binding response regulator [Bacteroidaceae bacterium]|nr:DNA-binding response regulator [Bacteroidaceae bacterium]